MTTFEPSWKNNTWTIGTILVNNSGAFSRSNYNFYKIIALNKKTGAPIVQQLIRKDKGDAGWGNSTCWTETVYPDLTSEPFGPLLKLRRRIIRKDNAPEEYYITALKWSQKRDIELYDSNRVYQNESYD